MVFVALRRWAIETDLKGDALARQGAQRREPGSRKQHAVGEDGGWRGRGTGKQDFADIRQHERLAAGDKNLFDTELLSFARDPPHPLDAKRPPRRFGGRAHADRKSTRLNSSHMSI